MLEEKEISRKFEKGFRGRSDGDLNKAFLVGPPPPPPPWDHSESRKNPNFVQILFWSGQENGRAARLASVN